MNKSVYRMGTRKSLLAIAQSSWVARELERLTPGIRIELVGIETRGDVVLDKPLSQVEGKEFFTAELDHALMRGEVDFTVHSMKDLSLDRPAQITLAATPKREFAHDIIIFNESVIERLKAGLPVRVGTSSLRRLAFIPGFLKSALPRLGKEPVLKFLEIRGNVNTRISRIHETEESGRKLDAVVLAFAGLQRLAIDPTASIELKKLLVGTRKMVLPLKDCPSAPAQGALAIEAATAFPETIAMIRKLHDPQTLQGVKEERNVLAEWGGGCHQELGASFLSDGSLIVRGIKPSGEFVSETRGSKFQKNSFVKIEASDLFDFQAAPLSSADSDKIAGSKNIFLAHVRAYEFLENQSLLGAQSKKHIWVSGMKSWSKLATAGVWVEGCVEGAGYQKMAEFQAKKLLALEEPFLFLTHSEAQNQTENALATYSHRFREIPAKLKDASSLFWSSGLLFRKAWSTLGAEFMLTKKHASGPGKSAEALSELLTPHGVNPDVFTLES